MASADKWLNQENRKLKKNPSAAEFFSFILEAISTYRSSKFKKLSRITHKCSFLSLFIMTFIFCSGQPLHIFQIATFVIVWPI